MPQDKESLSLSDIPEPIFEIKVSAEVTKTYDPFELMEKVETLIQSQPTGGEKPPTIYAAVRAAAELPDLSRNQCLFVWKNLNKFVNNLQITKDMVALSAPATKDA